MLPRGKAFQQDVFVSLSLSIHTPILFIREVDIITVVDRSFMQLELTGEGGMHFILDKIVFHAIKYVEFDNSFGYSEKIRMEKKVGMREL